MSLNRVLDTAFCSRTDIAISGRAAYSSDRRSLVVSDLHRTVSVYNLDFSDSDSLKSMPTPSISVRFRVNESGVSPHPPLAVSIGSFLGKEFILVGDVGECSLYLGARLVARSGSGDSLQSDDSGPHAPPVRRRAKLVDTLRHQGTDRVLNVHVRSMREFCLT